MENNYYLKYLKYKSKYLELKKQLGGDLYDCNKLGRVKCTVAPRCTWDNNLHHDSGKCRDKICDDHKNIITCGLATGCKWDTQPNKPICTEKKGNK